MVGDRFRPGAVRDPLVDRMVREWEWMRLSQAEAMGPRLESADDDTYIARVFRL